MKIYVFLFLSVFAFSLLGSVTVTSPNGGETLDRGMQWEIRWLDNISENVKIELFQNDIYHADIVASTPSDGSYIWDIPNTIMGVNFKVKISSVTNPTVQKDMSNGTFIIEGGILDLMFPDGGEVFMRGDVVRIQWHKDFPDYTEKVKVELYQNNVYFSTLCDSTEYEDIDWFIPFDLYGENFKIKVSSVIIPDLLYDISNGYFTISRGTIVLNYPNGGEIFESMGQMNIFWTDDIIEKVKIELYQNDLYYATTSDSTESDGEYLWDIPADISGNFKLKITSIYDEGVFAINEYTFEIIKYEITILTPNGGEQLARYTPFEITWSDNIDEDVRIELFKDDISYFYINDTESDGSFTWSPDVFAGNFKIKITSVSNDSIYDFSDATFEILKGNIALTFPVGGEILEMAEANPITWIDDIYESVEIYLYKGSTEITNFWTLSNGSYDWNFHTGTLVADSDYKIKIRSSEIEDLYDESGFFTIKGTNNVEGSVSGAWTEANSPYVLTDSTYIESANSLIIEPNVKVKPAYNYQKFGIFGKIEACGEADREVNFNNVTLKFDNSLCGDSSFIKNAKFDFSDEDFLFDSGNIFGGRFEEYGESVDETSDGGFILTGSTYTFGTNGFAVWLIKTDSRGNKLWDKTFGGLNGMGDFGRSVQETADGGYIIAGYTAVGYSVWLIKTDSSGNKVWDKTYGGTSDDEGYSVQQTSDGGYIITGCTNSYGAGSYDVWLIKTDASGNKIWDKTFGGTGYDEGQSVLQTTDGGFIITGRTNSYGAGDGDIWLIKTDSSGNKVWDKTFGGSSRDYGYSVQQTTDMGYIVAGLTESYGAGEEDAWLIKTDSGGNKTWDKTFGGTAWDYGYSVQETRDGGYIVTGSLFSDITSHRYIWLLKTDSGGNKKWDKTFGCVNGNNTNSGNCVKETISGDFVITGNTTRYNEYSSEMFIIITSEYGNIFYNNLAVNDSSRVVIQNSKFQGNINSYSMITNNAAPVISNCLFTGNNGGIKFIDSSPQFVINNTIADNDSIGLFFEGNSDPRLMNNIIYGNGSHEVYLDSDDSDPVFRFNDIEGGQAGFGLNTGVTYTGLYESNLNTDPLFVTGAYQLQETSPCKDSGYPGLTDATLGTLYIPQTDIADSLRLCGEIDMGCYEYYVAVVTPDSPANVVISVSADSLSINWDAASNANSYLIYSSDVPYGTFDYLATVGTNAWSTLIGSDTRRFYHIISSTESLKGTKPVAKKIGINRINEVR